jgi:hypothetical protein
MRRPQSGELRCHFRGRDQPAIETVDFIDQTVQPVLNAPIDRHLEMVTTAPRNVNAVPLQHQQTAIDLDRLAGNEVCPLACKEHHIGRKIALRVT